MDEDYFIKLDNLDSESELRRDDFEPSQLETEGQHRRKRETKQDNVKHFLAGTIILSYIFLLIISCFFNFELPKSYETLALIVVGYYFARYF